jgi:hypothetical protein
VHRGRELALVPGGDDAAAVHDLDRGVVDDLALAAAQAQAEVLLLLVEEVALVESPHRVERGAAGEQERPGHPGRLGAVAARDPVRVPGAVGDARADARELAVVPDLRAAGFGPQQRPGNRHRRVAEALEQALEHVGSGHDDVGVHAAQEARRRPGGQQVVPAAEPEVHVRRVQRDAAGVAGRELGEILGRAVLEDEHAVREAAGVQGLDDAVETARQIALGPVVDDLDDEVDVAGAGHEAAS